jgi:hypothetical protein
MKTITEHSKKLKIETSKEWNKNNTKYNFNVKIRDIEIAEFAEKNIANKTQFLIDAIKRYMAEKKTA